jgi:hypothetical protein
VAMPALDVRSLGSSGMGRVRERAMFPWGRGSGISLSTARKNHLARSALPLKPFYDPQPDAGQVVGYAYIPLTCLAL